MSFAQIAYTKIGPIYLLHLIGIIAITLFIFSAIIAILNVNYNIRKIPFKWHKRTAITAIIIALIHGTLALLSFLGI